MRTFLQRFALVALASTACSERSTEPPTPPLAPSAPAPVAIDPDAWQFFAQLPEAYASEANPLTDEKIALGRMLYYETRLSRNHDVSCNSCHDLARYGVDNEPRSPGHKGQLGGRNSPTVYNAGDHIAQFWDGRAPDLEEQALGPILNILEMAMPNERHVLRTLASIPEYRERFAAAFPGERDPITYANVGRAIAAFERKLVTPGRFDRFLAGDHSALTDDEQRGFGLFYGIGCTTCHNSAAVGGKSFQKLGLINPYPDQRDLGRFAVTGLEQDKMVFRVPSLRNVAETAPYFMHGELATLDETVRTMAWHQLGKQLTDEEARLIVAFLRSLTGELPADYIAKPELPPSTARTPKPDPS